MSTHTYTRLEINPSEFRRLWKLLRKSSYLSSLVTTGTDAPYIDPHEFVLVAASKPRANKASARKPLHEVNWLHLGTTNQYGALKKRLQRVVHDVVAAGCIDELVINDIVRTFQQHGFIVVPKGKA